MFTARRLDPETGLYYYRARIYCPTLGRFLQTDPIGYSDGVNLYVYVGNNPIVFVDAYGLCKNVPREAPQDVWPVQAGSSWKPVPGIKGWDVRKDQPHHNKDQPHEHYKYKNKPRSRKVDPRTKNQRPHGQGVDRDIPEEVIDAAEKAIIIEGMRYRNPLRNLSAPDPKTMAIVTGAGAILVTYWWVFVAAGMQY